MMKKYTSVWLALCLCGVMLLGGCGEDSSTTADLPIDVSDVTTDDVTDAATTTQTTEMTIVSTTTEPTTTTTEPTTTPTEPEDKSTADATLLVTDAYYNKIEYHEDLNDQDVTLEYALPQIRLDGDAIAAVNEEILATYQPIIDKELATYEEGCSNICMSIEYDWTVNGDVLSLIITETLSWHDPDPYRVYNISIGEARLLTIEEMYDLTALDQATIKDMLGSYYVDMYGHLSDTFDEFYYRQLENTVTDDNAAQAMIYLDENGEVCVVGKIYSLAGADYYSYIIPANDYVPNPDYEAYVSSR